MDSPRLDRTCRELKNPKVESREAAYIAYLLSLKEELFIPKALHFYAAHAKPSSMSLALAYEIAQGTCRMALALDHIALSLSKKNTLKLKLKEKALLRLALYQLFYLGNSPKHAIGDISVSLAKKYCSSFFANFLNAIIRAAADQKKEDLLPQDDSIRSLSIRYSFPIYFVEKMINAFGVTKSKTIFADLNTPKSASARKLGSHTVSPVSHENLENTAQNPEYYIQNITPALLADHLFKMASIDPKKILDLCASPGGKLILARELYPNAELFANDVSKEKVDLLASNLQKYGINAALSMARGEEFTSQEQFDLIILDVPCSNTGVLHKKAEARWRLNEENLKALNELQEKLIANALKLLKKEGVIWYMTCSILPDENLAFLEKLKSKYHFKIEHPHLILPEDERDGGFGCILTLKTDQNR